MKIYKKPIINSAMLFLCCLILLHYTQTASAQGEQNIWAFGYGKGIDFNTPTPTFYGNQLTPGDGCSASVCDATGQMLFYTNGFWVWNKNHHVMPGLSSGLNGNSNNLAANYPPMMPFNGATGTQPAAIARMPAHPSKYYIFSLSVSGQLFYTQVDMDLDSSRGDVASGQKRIMMDAGLTEKLTVVNGCNNIWVIVRSKNSNQYKAFELNDTGVVLTPVISDCGNLPLAWYRCGVIKFSADRLKMAAACNDSWTSRGGLELYDFNPQSGKLSNTMVLDSSSTLGYYYGACFSPDNQLLYATTASFNYSNIFYYGKVHQFNVSLGSIAAIAASNTVVFTNPVYEIDNLGDLKRAINGKMYFSNGQSGMNCINSPNSLGIACNPASNVMTFPTSYYEKGLTNDIAFINPPDTIDAIKHVAFCFKQNAILQADTGKLYVWDNGSTSWGRNINSAGLYVVHYINLNCQYETDSIYVRFIPLPNLQTNSYSCPNQSQGMAFIQQPINDTNTFQYQWKDINGNILQNHTGNHGDTLTGIDTGIHYVQITTASGCDTTIPFTILSLPKPHADFRSDSIACKGTPVSFLNQSSQDAIITKWYFGDGNFSNLQNTDYSYGITGDYTISLTVTNIEGCSDTIQKEMKIKGLDLRLSADKDWINIGEQVRLKTSANESYNILSWAPLYLCPEQTVYTQTITLDTTQTIWVSGISEYGCKDNASVVIHVRPIVMMPSAFSPNGDGLNDRFNLNYSGDVLIRTFEVYNRYGQQVFNAYGGSALQGWDGTYKGQLQDMGTYYYLVIIDTKENKNITLKGDVTLIR